jgi:uncharacterized protein (DUF1501 family)
MQTNRRFFLRNGALAIAGTTAIPSFLVRSVMAEAAPASPGRRLVVIFQRGAADGLNVVVPYREKNYYAMRPGIAIPDNQVIDLDGFFGLHPSLAPSSRSTTRAISPSSTPPARPTCPAPTSTRRTTWSPARPASKSTEDGWLNRALQAEDLRHRQEHTRLPRPRSRLAGPAHPRRQSSRHRALQRQQLHRRRKTAPPSPAANAFQAMYGESGDSIFHATGEETFEAVKMLRDANPAQYKPAVPAPNIPTTNSATT